MPIAMFCRSQALVPPAAGDGQRQEDIPMPIEELATQDQAHHLRYFDSAQHNVMHHLPPPPNPVVPDELGFNDYATPIEDPGARAQVYDPPTPQFQRNDVFAYAPQRATAGPDRAFPDEWLYQVPALILPRAENLRRLASRYVHHPDARVDMVRVEPGPAGRFKVVITLEIDNFL
ncbi:hypothetical protein BJV78DRAFT_1156600 [Lactifluus subvellereus]|nr:hypothetical protein BJV78DRAFT_1156600 [Lactifluus subvellereus]